MPPSKILPKWRQIHAIKKVVLTHIGLGNVDKESISKVFSDAGFKGEIIAAVDGLAVNP
ncbi:hypothetical protein QFZ28_005566 [Neobacillus niacini]|jgi:hypothetical protein|uniref:hypothetical protein n=1 Tax=Neobacillus niacini TaxID=86668 RepID=UPI00277D5EBC|nr:hypothetical protein [Neobacillus niacini]MDQ1005026.1 hypothetical protein [Neobacillus niacini]